MAAAETTRLAGKLPAERTSFVGRRRELGEARRLLSTGRLLTLTGPGGVGKTRLALRIAEQVRRAFPDGVFLVELAALHDPGLLPQTVAAAIGLRDASVRGWRTGLRGSTGLRSGVPLPLTVDPCLGSCAGTPVLSMRWCLGR